MTELNSNYVLNFRSRRTKRWCDVRIHTRSSISRFPRRHATSIAFCISETLLLSFGYPFSTTPQQLCANDEGKVCHTPQPHIHMLYIPLAHQHAHTAFSSILFLHIWLCQIHKCQQSVRGFHVCNAIFVSHLFAFVFFFSRVRQ